MKDKEIWLYMAQLVCSGEGCFSSLTSHRAGSVGQAKAEVRKELLKLGWSEVAEGMMCPNCAEKAGRTAREDARPTGMGRGDARPTGMGRGDARPTGTAREYARPTRTGRAA